MDLIVIPTYNERDNIGRLLEDLVSRPELERAHVLVVDDSSPDGTAEIVLVHALRCPRIFLYQRTAKEGLGQAYRAGFDWALQRDYDVVVQMDADGSHPASAVAELIAALGEADVAIGSRYVPGGQTRGWSWHRRLVSAGGNAYVRRVLAVPVHDATAGFRAFRAPALRLVLADSFPGSRKANDYCFQVETTWRAHRIGMRIAEVPITFTERVAGTSKMSLGIAWEALWLVLGWRIAEIGDGVNGLAQAFLWPRRVR